MMSSIRAIVFDFDNTLVKSHIDFPKLKRQMARSLESCGYHFGSDEDIPKKYTAMDFIKKAEKHDQENGTQLAKELWALVEEFERAGMQEITIEKDLKENLASLKQHGLRLTILTNNAKKPTLEVLRRFSLEPFFDLVIAREDVKQMKPEPDGIFLLLQQLDLSPEEVVFVGDSWVDALAAKRSGVRFVLIRNERLEETKYNIRIWKHIRTIGELYSLLFCKAEVS